MKLPKITKTLIATLLAGSLQACAAEPDYPPDFTEWNVGFAGSLLYPVMYSYDVYGVNEKEDWTSLIHPQIIIHGNPEKKLSRIRRLLGDQKYEGYELQLGEIVKNSQIAGTKTLPDQVYVRWTSIINENEYFTVLDVTKDMKTVMKTPRLHPRGLDYPCYQTTFVFGFLPDGRAKVWLEGCRIFTYVGELEPKAKNLYQGEVERAPIMDIYEKQAGKSAYPIPWDKVNKVYYPKERFTMNTLEEALSEAK
ncbi:DUF2931 family protein [Vibrio jasicida]|uniref:DUF2931 family protein n=1 Tax=Vibrio jasicida TaxID=766224 RepID=UPI0005EFFEB4|nr:DUF2931 family protein [Vibrio jasicida]